MIIAPPEAASWEKLVEDYLPLLRSIARKFSEVIPYEDAFSAGSLGLVKSAKRYVSRPSVYRFATLANLGIRSAIVDEIRVMKGRIGSIHAVHSVPLEMVMGEDGDRTKALASGYRLPVDPEPSIIDRITTRELLETLTAAIADLEEEEQRYLSLRYVNGFSMAATRAVLGISDSSLKRLHATSMEKLREAMQAAGFDGPNGP